MVLLGIGGSSLVLTGAAQVDPQPAGLST